MSEDEAEAILALADEVRGGLELADDDASFREDWRIRFAAERVIERIFQAANDLTEARRERYFGDAGFRALRGMRNRLAHNYLDIDEDILWDSLSEELPQVERRLAPDADEARQLIDNLLAAHVTDSDEWDSDHLGSVSPTRDEE